MLAALPHLIRLLKLLELLMTPCAASQDARFIFVTVVDWTWPSSDSDATKQRRPSNLQHETSNAARPATQRNDIMHD